jgi:phosphohistidine swiveling domain-containing protein
MKWFHSSSENSSIEKVGGKGAHLQMLSSWKANVAPFVVISTDVCAEFIRTGLIPSQVKLDIEAFITIHGKVALRSSMTGEDNAAYSFAGLFETFLDVDHKNWEDSLKKIYASLGSDRVINYIKLKNINIELNMAVVIQKEIRVEKSGVLFTRSPMEPTSAIGIDAAFGMGEGVVSGLVDVAHYSLTRLGEIIQGSDTEVLTSEQLQQLVSESLRLEEFLGKPSDIEWGYIKDELYIFQIRPITTNFSPLKVFADTNLSESYPGKVSPFTATFVQKVYENVFTESAIILGAKGKRLDTLKSHYGKIIGVMENHLYYDLEHYYAILRSLPGAEKNITNWHKMIGGKIEGLKIPYHATSLTTTETIQAVYSLLNFAFKKKTHYSTFLNGLEALVTKINKETEELETSNQTIQYQSDLLKKSFGFGLTVANDVLIMIGLGMMGSRFKKRGIPEDSIIDLLKTAQSLDSVKPLHAFEKLSLSLSHEFIKDFESHISQPGLDPYSKTFQYLQEMGWETEVLALANFLNEYGDRSFEELKIESLPFKNDPQLLLTFLKWGKKTQSMEHSSKRNLPIKLNFIDQKIIKFTRECIEFRETSRLWRGRFYQLFRIIILRLASSLQSEDPEWEKFKLADFFSITHLEWDEYLQGKLKAAQLRDLMNLRIGWQTKEHNFPEFICWSPLEKLPQFSRSEIGPNALKGHGVSPGIVEGRALVLENPTDAMETEISNYILVTKNTDPAWVYIMSRSMGLISEKGSMLSHTAIIGRELGVPTIVGVKSATNLIKTGDLLKINGTTGEVTKI